jgi:hypothetical protein
MRGKVLATACSLTYKLSRKGSEEGEFLEHGVAADVNRIPSGMPPLAPS